MLSVKQKIPLHGSAAPARAGMYYICCICQSSNRFAKEVEQFVITIAAVN
jgi:hypothetical protein